MSSYIFRKKEPPEWISWKYPSTNDASFGSVFDDIFRSKIMEILFVLRGSKEVVSTLKDEEWYVRKAAAEALGKIGDEKAVKPLISALKDEAFNLLKMFEKNSVIKFEILPDGSLHFKKQK